MPTVTRSTPWRHLGRVPYAVWRKRILDAGGLPEYAERDVWEAAGDDSALMLEMLEAESSYASNFNKIPAENWNAWNLETAGNGLKFNSAVEGAQAWRSRLYDPNYKNGVYARTQTISDLIYAYAPPKDPITGVIWNDTEGYIKGLVAGINKNGIESSTTPEEPMAITFGRVPKPNITSRIVSNSLAWDDLGKRTIRGAVWHRMYGSLWGTDSYFRGEAIRKALTDYGVGVAQTDGAGHDGEILMWNDPAGGRSPYASGPVNNPIDDGAKFVSRYGKGAVNRDLVSIELSGSGSTALSPGARRAVVALTAYYADQYKVSWEDFPNIPAENRSFVLWHGEFYDGKRGTCPGSVVEKATDAMIGEIKALLKGYQSGETTEPEPAPEPEPTLPDIVPGVDWGIAIRSFGKALGSDYVLREPPKTGPLGRIYVERAKETGIWPLLTDRWEYDDGRVYYRFSSGWLAVFNDKDKSIRWIEEA